MKKVPVKSTGIVANTVANVIAELLTYQLPTMLVQFMTQFPVILLNDLSFPCPDDVMTPCLLRPSACREVTSDVAKNFWGRFLVWSVQATGMTWN